MQKKQLSDEKLNELIELRKAGDSFLKIEGKTGIDRRLAKRAYNEWIHGETLNELKQARLNVAAEAFNDHLDYLVRLAAKLRDHLNTPLSFGDTRYSEDLFRNFLETNILQVDHSSSQVDTERIFWRNRNLNKQLFDSLKQHTEEIIRWQALNEWEKAWDSCRELFNNLKIEGQKVLSNLFDEDKELLQEIKEWSQLERAQEMRTPEEQIIGAEKRMIESVLDAILKRIINDARESIPFGELIEPKVIINFQLIDRVSIFTEEEWIEKLVVICQDVAQHLLDNQIELFRQLYNEAYKIRKTTDELDGILDPIILRHIIITTPRCKLCPA